jgi:hypothetical protein
MALCLAGMTTRKELMGVTSIVRALGLVPTCYDRLLDKMVLLLDSLGVHEPFYFVAVDHPRRGTILLMSTDLNLDPLEIIRIYGLRFKIEGSFKQALRVIGAYAYHFWMAAMTPLRRVSGNQYLHHTSHAYRDAVRRKIAAYHRHIQLGLIAQGLLQVLAAKTPKLVWPSFGSWIRTIRPGRAPSEQVAAIALRNTLPEFLATAAKTSILVKFIRDRIDLSRSEGTSLAA